ncbi:hypothetical protein AVEN_157577-1 [Araneus ventricosus]|uniref:Uncharacterized protein n=1 Tax=Araneus ventricosus TaxID=182803 RepID=A0A4Y2Q357_ARAVE|nr:hypothetical protein AVEN_157577-1 [Araneus ventricosus]
MTLVLQLPSSARHLLQMDPQVSESGNSSHEYIFAADLLTFVLGQYKISWRWPLYPTGTTQHFFRPSIGRAISNFMIQKTAIIRDTIQSVMPENGSWNPENLKLMLNLVLLQRPGKEFGMLVTVNAYLCHIGVSLARRGDLRLVDDIVGIIAYVMRVLVGNENWRWLEAHAEGFNKIVRIPGGA